MSSEKTDVLDEQVIKHGKAAIQQLATESSPITHALIGCVIGIFIVEVWIMHTNSLGNLEVVAKGIFGVAPSAGWILSPFLHNSIPHFIVNIAGLILVGVPLEKHWSKKRYAVFLIAAGYMATVGGGVFLAIFTDQQIASYGVSGVVYALAGFGLIHLPRRHWPFDSLQWIVVLFGVSAMLSVVVDPFIGPYFEPNWINGGHLVGFVIGVVAGWFGWNS